MELIPLVSTAEDLAQALVATESLDSANILVITGNRNREILVNLLESVGHAIVDTLSVYSTDFADVSEAKDLQKFREKGADALVFNSSSAALSYIEQEEDLVLEGEARVPILCSLGAQTSSTLKENGLSVGLEAPTPNLDTLVDSLVVKFGRTQ